MEMLENSSMDFLIELYNLTEGDLDKQISMQKIGINLGLEKNAATSLGEELIMSECLELKTLAGGVSLTSRGLEILGKAGYGNSSVQQKYQLSGQPLLTSQDKNVVLELLAELRKSLSQKSMNYEIMEELVIDIKTLETQLLSNQPKLTIVLAVFSSLSSLTEKIGLSEIAGHLKALV